MISRYTYKDLVWVDLESPTEEEVRVVMEEFSVPPILGNELMSLSVRPRVDLYRDFIYLILHFPTITHKHGKRTEQEVDFIIGKKFIITTHYEVIDPLHEFSKVFEVNSILDKSNIGDHAGFIFFYIIRELYQSLIDELDFVDTRLEKATARMFSGEEAMMVETLSRINRDLLTFKQAIRYHRDVLDSFELAGHKLFGDDFLYYLRAITGEYLKVASLMDAHKETLTELRSTNSSLLTTKTNETMKVLTIMTFTMLPLSLMAAIFGMNADNMPVVEGPNGFWVVILLMLAIGTLTAGFFKYKRWF
ncbi:MAG: hypothetical protein A2675_03585 [Candidatus Yonathbacteria bacterium RIFCSPHIGHO2_01_FULL_51_10]|uniref:Magnesium transport protein CorA n=1 Tax=Candidatus Yonathbacteria bacterium RIFCSPHIGHO2_01_FULL_51_10 TaxID=1802723 RepID=A0A1G2SA32_9BACT|nr:MAG: hypothetical protein A2675_03585 [Candidatus Yonathbacteria bacterium RIFCSPHIGHO2_01_FULL_51_10]